MTGSQGTFWGDDYIPVEPYDEYKAGWEAATKEAISVARTLGICPACASKIATAIYRRIKGPT